MFTPLKVASKLATTKPNKRQEETMGLESTLPSRDDRIP